jgi:3-oxoacyl-(acyl-carrier-protein) synthase
MRERRVVITGRSVVSPLGVGFDDHWKALANGGSAIASLPHLAELGLGASRGACVSAEAMAPLLGRLPRKQQKLYNRPTLLAMLASALAMEEAGLPAGASAAERFGVLLGVNIASWDVDAMRRYVVEARSPESGALDMRRANAFCMHSINPLDYSLKTLPNLAAGHVAIAHEARGVCRTMMEGAVGGAHAIGQGLRLIEEGDLDVALCGGSEAQHEALLYAMYAGGGLLATDSGKAGMLAGEGSGMLVLEDAEHAARRSATVRGSVLGFSAAAGDGRLAFETDSEALASRLSSVIERAIGEAGVAPDVVSLHADGAPAHDDAEMRALERVLGERVASTPALRMKAAHGNLGAASPPVEVLACTAMLEAGSLDHALVLSIGLFGECAALMVGR